MTSLIFYATPEEVVVTTDTLATDPDDHAPVFFTTKAHYVPHLRMIIAGTGFGRFSWDWLCHVNEMPVCGIESLDCVAPEKLRAQWEDMLVPDELNDKTTTIYHFGYSEESHEIVVFAYRSANDFSSERLPFLSGVLFGAKPDCLFPEGGDLFEAIKTMMADQRRLEAENPPDDRVHIGGEAIAMHLTKERCNVFTLFRFPDYEEQMDQALNKLETDQDQD